MIILFKGLCLEMICVCWMTAPQAHKNSELQMGPEHTEHVRECAGL